MAVPTPHAKEAKDKFLDRCFSDKDLVNEYPDVKQRHAISESQWRRKRDKG